MINQFDEEITNEELTELVEEIQALTPLQIDAVWYYAGWIDKNKENNSALPDWRIHDIKNKKKFATSFIRELLRTTPFKDVLDAIEKAKEL